MIFNVKYRLKEIKNRKMLINLHRIKGNGSNSSELDL